MDGTTITSIRDGGEFFKGGVCLWGLMFQKHLDTYALWAGQWLGNAGG